MATTHEELSSFNRFATEKLNVKGLNLSIEELFDMWRMENPNPDLEAEDLAAVRVAIKDMENGDRGIPAVDHIREMREKYNLPSSE